MFEVVHIYLCIIIVIIKAIVVFVTCCDIIHIRQYVKLMGCDMQYWYCCCVLLVDLQTAVDLFCGPSPYQVLYSQLQWFVTCRNQLRMFLHNNRVCKILHQRQFCNFPSVITLHYFMPSFVVPSQKIARPPSLCSSLKQL